MRRVAITGIGLVTPIGNDLETTWSALVGGRSGAAPITLFDTSDFATKFSLAIGVGSFVGLAIGAVVGCIFGLPLFGVGCLAGIPIGATLGGIVGTIVAGGPTLVAAGVDMMNTINAKPGTTKWEQSVTQQPGSQQPARPQASPKH